MKKLCLLFAILSCCGCRSYHYTRTDSNGVRHEVWITSILSTAALSKLQVLVDTNAVLNLEGYSQKIDDKAIEAITEGVVAGLGRTIKPL